MMKLGYENRRYLGDSVYAHYDGYHVVLSTDNGYGPTNSISLDDSVLASLKEYVQDIYRRISEARNSEEQG